MDGEPLEFAKKFSKIASALGISAPVAFLIYIADNSPGVYPFFLMFGMTAATFYTIAFLLEKNRDAYLKQQVRELFVDYLHRLIYYKGRNGSYLKALGKAEEGIEDNNLRESVGKARKIYQMEGSARDATDCFDEELIINGRDKIKETIRSHNVNLNSKQTEIEESAQRYATFNMFASTILPSFLIFGFIGNSIVSQTGFGTLIFSVFLLLAVPLVYAVGNAFMWRRLFA